MRTRWQMREKKKEHVNLAYPVAGAVFAGLLGSAEYGRRLFRDSRLFDPVSEPEKSWEPKDHGFDPGRTDLLVFNSKSVTLHGWYCRAKRPRASILFCHGKSGNLTWFTRGVKALVDSGFNVFIFDYRGFGRSTGRPTIRGVVRDALAAATEHERLRPKDLPSILWGYSLGGAIGMQAFLRQPFDGIVLQSTFTSLPDITRLHYPGTPLHLLAGNLYDTASIVRDLTIPVLILHGDEDETVPFEMGRALHESCEGSTFLLIPGGMHRTLFETASRKICRATRKFVAAVAKDRSARLASGSLAPSSAPSSS